MSIRSIREFINLKIYSSKTFALTFFRAIIVVVSIIALATLIYYHGFPVSEERKQVLILVIQGSFIFYIFHYFLKFFYSFEPLQFLKDSWFEGIIMLFLFIEGLSYNLFDVLILSELFINLGIKNITHYYAIFIQVYLLGVVLVQVVKSSHRFVLFKIHPSNIFIFSFTLIILAGAGLLMLPEMTTIEGSMPFIDALFTSTSATCVTGLIVYDTPTYFSFKGQLIILVLMKLGGLNIIAFGSFVALASKFGMGIKQHEVIEDFVNKDSILSSKGMLGRVIIWSFAIELIGTVMIYLSWSADIPFKSIGEKLFFSVFHSFSAFNNAGFALFTDGYFNEVVQENYLLHLVTCGLMFLGGLGFIAIFELLDIHEIRERAKFPWKQMSFSTKIALYFSLGLTIFGAVMFYLLEADNTLQGKTASGIVTTSLFQSLTARTTGFNTVDFAAISVPTTIIFLFLMFVGASSSSTGGGIKTSTFALIWASTIATVRGRKNPELFQKTISKVHSARAFSVFLFFLVGNLLGVFILSITETKILAMEGRTILDLIFEEISAFSTVGLSTGITGNLSNVGKLVIVISMFVGRVGTMTVAYALGKKAISTNYKYPEGRTMIG